MTTIAATVANVRRILKDRPEVAKLTAAITDTTTETFTVSATDITKFGVGNVWEHDDGSTGAERRYVTAITPSTTTVTAIRGYESSTAATHSNSTYLIKDPRWPFDEIAQAINLTLDIELFNQGLYEVAKHQVTATASDAYDAPSANCEEFLWVYQQDTSGDPPRRIRDFTRLPRLVDTTLWATGRVFEIKGGTLGTTYYVNCKHKLAIGTLSSAHERIVLFLVAALLLEWEEPRRSGGPTNLGDRTVKPGTQAQMSAFYRAQAKELIARERAYLKALNPPYRNFRKEP